jgi:hypothetical protein
MVGDGWQCQEKRSLGEVWPVDDTNLSRKADD